LQNFKKAAGIKETSQAFFLRDKILQKYLNNDFLGERRKKKGTNKSFLELRFEL